MCVRDDNCSLCVPDQVYLHVLVFIFMYTGMYKSKCICMHIFQHMACMLIWTCIFACIHMHEDICVTRALFVAHSHTHTLFPDRSLSLSRSCYLSPTFFLFLSLSVSPFLSLSYTHTRTDIQIQTHKYNLQQEESSSADDAVEARRPIFTPPRIFRVVLEQSLQPDAFPVCCLSSSSSNRCFPAASSDCQNETHVYESRLSSHVACSSLCYMTGRRKWLFCNSSSATTCMHHGSDILDVTH